MLEKIFKVEISANIVAWYGAVVATAGIIISLLNYLRDRASILIKYEPNIYILGGDAFNYPSQVKHLSISVINTGRRPIRIDKAALKIYGSNKQYLLTDSFSDRRPKVITEESPITTFLVKQEKFDIEMVYCVVIFDGTGREYKKYVKKFPTVFIFWYWLKNKFNSSKKLE